MVKTALKLVLCCWVGNNVSIVSHVPKMLLNSVTFVIALSSLVRHLNMMESTAVADVFLIIALF